MDRTRGILFLADPLKTDSALQRQNQITNSMTLIFDENGRYLSLAQTALWRLRQRCGWICVAAEGDAACIAVALAAQLPVERLALVEGSLFLPRRRDMPRELTRLQAYARRNLSLVISEILLIGAQEAETRGFLRGHARGPVCVLEGVENSREDCQNILAAPWDEVCRNNLLIPWKCV